MFSDSNCPLRLETTAGGVLCFPGRQDWGLREWSAAIIAAASTTISCYWDVAADSRDSSSWGWYEFDKNKKLLEFCMSTILQNYSKWNVGQCNKRTTKSDVGAFEHRSNSCGYAAKNVHTSQENWCLVMQVPFIYKRKFSISDQGTSCFHSIVARFKSYVQSAFPLFVKQNPINYL